MQTFVQKAFGQPYSFERDGLVMDSNEDREGDFGIAVADVDVGIVGSQRMDRTRERELCDRIWRFSQ